MDDLTIPVVTLAAELGVPPGAAEPDDEGLEELEHARQLVAQYGSVAAAITALIEGRVPGYSGARITNGHRPRNGYPVHERGRLLRPVIEHSPWAGPIVSVR